MNTVYANTFGQPDGRGGSDGRNALSNFEKGGFDPTLKFEPGGFSAHFGLVARRIASTYGRYASLGRV